MDVPDFVGHIQLNVLGSCFFVLALTRAVKECLPLGLPRTSMKLGPDDCCCLGAIVIEMVRVDAMVGKQGRTRRACEMIGRNIWTERMVVDRRGFKLQTPPLVSPIQSGTYQSGSSAVRIELHRLYEQRAVLLLRRDCGPRMEEKRSPTIFSGTQDSMLAFSATHDAFTARFAGRRRWLRRRRCV